MSKYVGIPADYYVEVGTRDDDGRLGSDSLYIATGPGKQDMRVLTSTQGVELARYIMDAVWELRVRNEAQT